MTEKCTITITIDEPRSDISFSEEDAVKQIWPYMLPWFTRRHGVQSGKITLNNNVSVDWQYESIYDDADAYDAFIEARCS